MGELMSIRNRALSLMLCAAALAPVGCSDDVGDDDTSANDGALGAPDGGHDDVHHDAHMEYEEVRCEATHPGLKPGLSVMAGDLTVRVVSHDPERAARQKVKNDWVLEVVDGSGAPVTDVEGTSATAFMQVHGHYGLPAPVIVKLPEPGRFKLDNINFSMRGPWEVSFSMQRGEAKPNAKFSICVE
jgi:hypothetical protein